MILIINTLVTILAILLYSGLLIVVMVSRPQTELRRVFRWYLLSMTLSSLAAFLLYVDQTRALLWFRVMMGAGFITMVSVFRFSRSTINVWGKWDIIVTIFGAVTIGLSVFSNIVQSVTVESGIIHYELAPLTALLVLPGYFLIVISLAALIRAYRRSYDPIQQNRLTYLILGIAVMMIGSVINFTPFGKYPVDIAANGVTAILFVYAILRYQLLDIRVVIRQGLVYSIPTIIIGAAYFLIITLAINLIPAYAGVEIFMLSLVVAVISALVAEPLRNRAQRVIDRMFFREKYDYWRLLQDLSSRVAMELDLYKVTNLILTEVTSTLHIERAAFFLKDEESGKFQITTQIGLEESLDVSFRKGHPFILWFSSHHLPITMEDVEVLPQFQSMWKSERLDIENLETELFIPINVKSKMVGIFTLGPKRSEQVYSEEDKLFLSTIANQSAVAIENARLFTSEQNRRKEIDKLYNLSHQLGATDDLDIVLNSIAIHAVESFQVTYSRILTRENNGEYICRAIYPERNLTGPLGLGRTEPLVAEHYFNWILQHGQSVVLHINNPDLQEEEKQALFLNHASTLCLSPLKGVEEYIGILVLGEFHIIKGEPFSTTGLRLVNAIADQASGAIRRAMLHGQLEEILLQTVVSLAKAIDARDSYTADHSQRMADMATRISQAINLSEPEIEAVYWAGLLHDIGKIGVEDKILRKPGPLTKQEWVVMKEHPIVGANIVAPVKSLAPVAPLIRAHHERFDGSGYPYGLEGDNIPLGSRILAVVDAYMAIRDERVYSKKHTHKQSIKELKKFSGTQFDPQVVEVFCRIITE